MSHSYSADNKLTEVRNNANTILSVSINSSLPQSLVGGILNVQFPLVDAVKFVNHDYVGRSSVPSNLTSHGYISIGSEVMWYDGITTVGSNARFQVRKRRINVASASAYDQGRKIQLRVTAQHLLQLQAYVTSIVEGLTGGTGIVSVSGDYSFQYVGSVYNVGRAMWRSLTSYMQAAFGGNLSAYTGNWQNTFNYVASASRNIGSTTGTVISNSRNWSNSFSYNASASRNVASATAALNSNSRNWQSAYGTVNSNSATWGAESDSFSRYKDGYTSTTGSWTNAATFAQSSSADLRAATRTLGSNSRNWQNDFNYDVSASRNLAARTATLNSNSATWAAANSTLGSNSGNWQNDFNYDVSASANLARATATLNAHSGSWNNLGGMTSSTAGWTRASSTLRSNSGSWNNLGGMTSSTAGWNSASRTVFSNSRNWGRAYNYVESASRNIVSATSTLNGNSRNWQNSYNYVVSASRNIGGATAVLTSYSRGWMGTSATVFSNSATWRRGRGLWQDSGTYLTPASQRDVVIPGSVSRGGSATLYFCQTGDTYPHIRTGDHASPPNSTFQIRSRNKFFIVSQDGYRLFQIGYPDYQWGDGVGRFSFTGGLTNIGATKFYHVKSPVAEDLYYPSRYSYFFKTTDDSGSTYYDTEAGRLQVGKNGDFYGTQGPRNQYSYVSMFGLRRSAGAGQLLQAFKISGTRHYFSQSPTRCFDYTLRGLSASQYWNDPEADARLSLMLIRPDGLLRRSSMSLSSLTRSSDSFARYKNGYTSSTGNWTNAYLRVAGLSSSTAGLVGASRTLRSNSANWNNAYNWSNSVSANLAASTASVASTSATVASNSGNWNNGFDRIAGLSSSTAGLVGSSRTLRSNSANWNNAYNYNVSASANIRATTATLNAYSGSWNNLGGMTSSTAGWNSASSVVFSNSAAWMSSLRTVSSNSAAWGSNSARLWQDRGSYLIPLSQRDLVIPGSVSSRSATLYFGGTASQQFPHIRRGANNYRGPQMQITYGDKFTIVSQLGTVPHTIFQVGFPGIGDHGRLCFTGGFNGARQMRLFNDKAPGEYYDNPSRYSYFFKTTDDSGSSYYNVQAGRMQVGKIDTYYGTQGPAHQYSYVSLWNASNGQLRQTFKIRSQVEGSTVQYFMRGLSAATGTDTRRVTIYADGQLDTVSLSSITAAARVDSFSRYLSGYTSNTGNWTNAYLRIAGLSSSTAGLVGASRTLWSNSGSWNNLGGMTSSTGGWVAGLITLGSASSTLAAYSGSWNNLGGMTSSTAGWARASRTLLSNSANWTNGYNYRNSNSAANNNVNNAVYGMTSATAGWVAGLVTLASATSSLGTNSANWSNSYNYRNSSSALNNLVNNSVTSTSAANRIVNIAVYGMTSSTANWTNAYNYCNSSSALNNLVNNSVTSTTAANRIVNTAVYGMTSSTAGWAAGLITLRSASASCGSCTSTVNSNSANWVLRTAAIRGVSSSTAGWAAGLITLASVSASCGSCTSTMGSNSRTWNLASNAIKGVSSSTGNWVNSFARIAGLSSSTRNWVNDFNYDVSSSANVASATASVASNTATVSSHSAHWQLFRIGVPFPGQSWSAGSGTLVTPVMPISRTIYKMVFANYATSGTGYFGLQVNVGVSGINLSTTGAQPLGTTWASVTSMTAAVPSGSAYVLNTNYAASAGLYLRGYVDRRSTIKDGQMTLLCTT